jgi:hypothetical protein
MGRACRTAYKILVGKAEEKRSLGRAWCRWEANIGLGLREIGSEGVDWLGIGTSGGPFPGDKAIPPFPQYVFMARYVAKPRDKVSSSSRYDKTATIII